MNEDKLLKLVQEYCDKKAQDFVFKRTAKLDLIHQEDVNGTTEAYVLGSDMPNLIYRIFYIKNNTVTEENNINTIVEKSNHYKYDIQPNLKLVPPAVNETQEYEIILENRLNDGAGVEVKLRSSVLRDITMVETYRYFDYVSKIFFVSCLAISFGGQYLFSVTPDGKHLRLILGRNEEISNRMQMINDLLQARMLPSYQTVAAGHDALTNPKAKARIELKNTQTGETHGFISNFSYDDLESGNMFSFFTDEKDSQNGLIFIQDVLTGSLTMSENWNDEQKSSAQRVLDMMKNNPDGFNKNAHSYFADSLDLRYKAYKDGRKIDNSKSENKEADANADSKPVEENKTEKSSEEKVKKTKKAAEKAEEK